MGEIGQIMVHKKAVKLECGRDTGGILEAMVLTEHRMHVIFSTRYINTSKKQETRNDQNGHESRDKHKTSIH